MFRPPECVDGRPYVPWERLRSYLLRFKRISAQRERFLGRVTSRPSEASSAGHHHAEHPAASLSDSDLPKKQAEAATFAHWRSDTRPPP